MSTSPADLRNIAKNNFKCYQLPDSSVYYGEVAYLNKKSQETYPDLESIPEEAKSQIVLVRHGYGIQLFGRNDNNELCNYAGEFKNDLKHGRGIFSYPDGSRYEDGFMNGKFHGHGIYTFPKSEDGSQR